MEDIPTVSQEIDKEVHVSIQMENINIASQDTEIEGYALIKTELQHDPVVTSMRGMLESLSPLSSNCCIYRVPKKLRKVNAEAYTPHLVSIGPFHRGEKHLQSMEEHKLRYMKTFLNRTGRSLEDCVKVVRTWEKRARDCYAETIELSSDEFVKMILVDGSFIVVLLLRNYFPKLTDEIDRIFYKPWMNNRVREDLVLLENQLPFFVLQVFFNLLPASNLEVNRSFLELTYEYFNFLLELKKLPDTISGPGIEHFVDFIHRCYLPPFSRVMQGGRKGNAKYERPPSVTKLHEAGVKFKMGTSSSLLDIKFTNGILEIPHLEIHDQMETLFRNVIVFEQCHRTNDYISDYFALLNGMINSSKDVDLLIQRGIITNMLGSSEDFSALFNNIFKEVSISSHFYFSTLCEDLNAYCKYPWHKWKAALRRDYFSTPWAITSIIAAVLLIVLTFIQSVCSLISL